jgi:predicted DNA-binding transcriptional regulator AlpA
MQKIGSHRGVMGRTVDSGNAASGRPKSPSWMSAKEESQTNRAAFSLNDPRHEAICDKARLITEREAAEQLALSVKTLRNWRFLGRGPPHLKVGRLVRYRLSDLKSWLKTCERASTSDPGDGHV